MTISMKTVIECAEEPWFVTRLNFESEQSIQKFEQFIEKRLHRVDVHPAIYKALRELKLAYVISRLGPIENNQMRLSTSIYAPIGAQGDFSGDEEVGDLVDVIASWKHDYATSNFGMRLRLAHERNIRQIENFDSSSSGNG